MSEVEHIFGPPSAVVADLEKLLDAYRKGGMAVAICGVSPVGGSEFIFLDAQGGPQELARLTTHLAMLHTRVLQLFQQETKWGLPSGNSSGQ
jgi:hypothetical protein